MAALLLCPAAFADTYTFNYSGAGTIASAPANFYGSGTITTSMTPVSGTSNQYAIQTITGTANGVPILGLLTDYPSAATGNTPADNDIFSSLVNGGLLDVLGFSFATTDGTDYNVYYYGSTLSPGYGLVTGAAAADGTTNLLFSLVDDSTPGTPGSGGSATPEPGSLALLATGIVGIAGAVRRKFAV